jgi:hypothetical protein
VKTRLATAGALVGLAAGCGGTPSEPDAGGPAPTLTVAAPPTSPAPATTTAPPATAKAEPLRGLPRFTAGYKRWVKLNGKPIPPRQSGDAHLGTKNVYASEKRHASGRFPNGTVIVKEAVRPGKDFLGLVAVMRKERGSDPAHHDWQFVEYTRAASGGRFTATASDSICWNCHVGAEKTDYVWIYTLGLAR